MTVSSCFQCSYRLYLEITLFCTKPSEQIVYCHVTDVKMLKKISLLNNDTIGLSLPQISGIYLNTLQSRNVSAKSAGSKVDV